jgi:UDPglucose--hexose-1-phosphate uridylyltransferase
MVPRHELRWDPLLEEWVIVAAHRQERPHLPGSCPFCPGSPGILEQFDVISVPNKYPALSIEGDTHETGGIYARRDAKGYCEIVLYTPEHDLCLGDLDPAHIKKLVDLWASRYETLGEDPDVRYVFIFENRGEEIGVTLTHPHGQIYAFPFIPPKIQREIDSSRSFWEREGKCLFCSILDREIEDGERIVGGNGDFVYFVPFAGRWPYELHLYPKRHVGSLSDLSGDERTHLAHMIREIVRKYDNLFGYPMPYMMIHHQQPTDGQYDYYHFHIEFYPVHRGRGQTKYLGGVESGAGTFINPTMPEEKARELRQA